MSARTNDSSNDGNEVLQRAVAANQALMANTDGGRAYKGEFQRYKKWLAKQTGLQQEPVLSVENVETYFADAVANRPGKPKTVDKWVAGMQYYIDRAPKGPHLPAGFKCRYNEAIKTALMSQKIRNIASGGTANPGSDPHKGLKDQIRTADRNKLMNYIYNHRLDWGQASFSFTWGLNAGVRGASNRRMNYSDLNMSYGFAPPCATEARDDGNRAALILILRSGDRHKDRHDTDEQVAVWRHRRYKECSVFATAAHVLWSLSTNNTLNFKHLDKKKPAPWWEIPLLNWDDYNGTSVSLLRPGCVSTWLFFNLVIFQPG